MMKIKPSKRLELHKRIEQQRYWNSFTVKKEGLVEAVINAVLNYHERLWNEMEDLKDDEQSKIIN